MCCRDPGGGKCTHILKTAVLTAALNAEIISTSKCLMNETHQADRLNHPRDIFLSKSDFGPWRKKPEKSHFEQSNGLERKSETV